MTPDQFQELIRRHGGVTGTAVKNPTIETETPNLDPTKDPIKSKTPNPTPIRHYVLGDGTEFEMIVNADGSIDVTDPGTAMPAPKDAKTPPNLQLVERGGKTYRFNPQTGELTPVEGVPAEPAKEQIVEGADGRKYRIVGGAMVPLEGQPAEVPKQDEVFPDAKVPPARPGQRTDLNAVMTAFQQYSAQLYQQAKAGTITWAQAQTARDQYYQQTVAPAAARANQEANDYAAQQQARQAEQDAREREQGQRARDLAERQARQAEASQRLGEERFFAEAGQNAVKNATDLLRYQANPAFSEDFARALNTVSSGGGAVNFRPEAFRINLPDVNAIAEQAAQRAAAHYAARAVPYAGAAAGGVPAAGTAPMSVQQSLDAVPLMAPRSMPGAAPLPALPPPIDPRLLQGSGGPGAAAAY